MISERYATEGNYMTTTFRTSTEINSGMPGCVLPRQPSATHADNRPVGANAFALQEFNEVTVRSIPGNDSPQTQCRFNRFNNEDYDSHAVSVLRGAARAKNSLPPSREEVSHKLTRRHQFLSPNSQEIVGAMGRRSRIHDGTQIVHEVTGASTSALSNNNASPTMPVRMPAPNSKYRRDSVFDNDCLSPSSATGTEKMYDWATWRMYERITAARRKKAAIAPFHVPLPQIQAKENGEKPGLAPNRDTTTSSQPRPSREFHVHQDASAVPHGMPASMSAEPAAAPVVLLPSHFSLEEEEDDHEGEIFALDI